jgi:hypothetical protein
MALTNADKEWINMALAPIKHDTDHINQRLDKINGSVQKHEQIINEAVAERGENRVYQIVEFGKLDKVVEKVDKIDETLMEYKMIKRYPKAFIGMATAFILWMGWEVLQNFVL